ncbi:MAG: hypothetical protein WC979_01425 [Candidatus Pacearchaeota archaeon]|jgi:hypothetical protein|nr:hypothetical protein [Clostridia bacterium]
MKNRIPSLNEFIFIEKSNAINEAIEESGLEFATRHGLEKTTTFKTYLKGEIRTVCSLFHYEAGWPTAGLRYTYFGDEAPVEKFKEVIKSATTYLKTGVASAPIIEFVAFLYTDAAPGGRSQGPLSDAIKRIEPEFKAANKDLPAMRDALTNIINVLKSWTSDAAASLLNVAVAVARKTSYSAYAGSDFTKVLTMTLDGLKKNKVKVTPTSKIEIDKNNTSISSDTIHNSIGFVQIDTQRWSSVVTVKVDGKEFIAGSFENQSAYGRY